MSVKFIIIGFALIAYGQCELSARCRYVLKFDSNGNPPAEGAPDVCHSPFAAFLKCIGERVDGEVDAIVAESSPQNQQAAKTCFSTNGCGTVSYDPETALNAFVPCAYPKGSEELKRNCQWRYAANEIFGLLEDMPRPVSVCMIRYFKKVATNKIEQCTREYDPKVSPDFKMPPLPGVEHLTFDDIKNVLLYQVMTRYYVGKCKCDGRGNPSSLASCLANGVSSRTDLCPLTRQCENSFFGPGGSAGAMCSKRYFDVHKSACNCLAGEVEKGLKALENWDELKKMFVGGELECNLETCYVSTGNEDKWGVMKDRIRELKSGVIRAFTAYQSGGLPQSLQDALFVFKQIFDELKGKINTVLCGECSADDNERQEREVNLNNLWQAKDCNADPQQNARPINIPAQIRPSANARASANANVNAGFEDFFNSK